MYRICKRCIMDTSDPNIQFDAHGLCDYCNNFDATIQPNWHTDEQGAQRLSQLADQIRAAGKGKDFDCIIGLSGGLDSSYAAYVAKEKMGLRPSCSMLMRAGTLTKRLGTLRSWWTAWALTSTRR